MASPLLLCLPNETSSLRDIPDMPSSDMVFLSLGSSAGQLEDLTSGASGLPRQQVPMPSQASPPPLSNHGRLLEGSTGKGWGPRQVWVYIVTACAWVLVLSGVRSGQVAVFLFFFFFSRQALTISVPSYVVCGSYSPLLPTACTWQLGLAFVG